MKPRERGANCFSPENRNRNLLVPGSCYVCLYYGIFSSSSPQMKTHVEVDAVHAFQYSRKKARRSGFMGRGKKTNDLAWFDA